MADGLTLCEEKKWIKDCAGTTKFIRIFDEVFDILNCQSVNGNEIIKLFQYIFFKTYFLIEF